MIYLRRLFLLVTSLLMVAGSLSSCIEDGITTSPAHQPVFSTDTLDMGNCFTGEPNPTHRMMVYNRHNKILNISSISFRNAGQSTFRINVDGQSGSSFQNIEIRPNDSIFVFVESTLPPNGNWLPTDVAEIIDFVTNGVTSSVVVTARGEDIERYRGTVIDTDTRWTGDRPYQIFDSLVVRAGATLTLEAGCRLYFHDNAELRVEGTLRSEGTSDRPIDLCGDRRGNVVSDISFDLMASQWSGVYFSPTSRNNMLSHTLIRNTVNGVVADTVAGEPSTTPILTLVNCRLRNSAGYALAALGSGVDAVGCEIADAANGVLLLDGGTHRFINCTFANYYLFSALRGPAITLSSLSIPEEEESPARIKPLSADFTNCIVYGNGSDVGPSDLTGSDVVFRRTLFKSSGSDDDNFIDCIWDKDPLYYTERSEYIFDYRVKPESPAINAADPAFIPPTADFYGIPRSGLTLGAYEFVAPSDTQK